LSFCIVIFFKYAYLISFGSFLVILVLKANLNGNEKCCPE